MEQAQITSLKFPDNVRLRKEMYLIDPNHCIYEIIDNAVDEYSAGRCNEISVDISKVDENEKFPFIIIKDNGGGIPTTMKEDAEGNMRSQLEIALGSLSSSGKYGREGGYTTVTSGLHGVGASCVNAVSDIFIADVYSTDNKYSAIKWHKGIKESETLNKDCVVTSQTKGTTISFRLDKDLWKDEQFDFDIIKRRLKQLSYLNPGLMIKYLNCNENTTDHDIYIHKDGIAEYFKDLTANKSMLASDAIIINKTIEDEELGPVQISLTFGYSTGYSSETYSFVNNVSTQSGDHVTGFNTGISKAINSYFKDNDKYKNLIKNLTGEDCREGLISIISIKVMSPKFEGQSKNSIKMPRIRTIVNDVVSNEFKYYLDQHPAFSKLLADKLEKAVKARIASKKAREAIRNAKSTLESSLPGKLMACSSKKPEECELYIVEGDSAAGSAEQGRDSKTQAILPVFGKILNTEKSRENEVLNNGKLLDVIKALKCGIGKNFDIDKIRYHKVILMADADVDGAHISTLWITFFYRHMPEIIEKGYLYIALSPIYRVTEKAGKKEIHRYFYNDEELAAYKTNNPYHISYIKGLGELQPEQLWESTMNPETRRMVRVKCIDQQEDSEAIEVCMGTDVESRRKFILEKADFTKVVE